MTPLLVVVPLLGAALVLVVPRGLVAAAGLTGALATAATAAVVTVQVAADGPVRHTAAGWPAPLGMELRVDGLSAVLLAMTGFVALIVSVHAAADRKGATRGRWFWVLWGGLWSGLNAVYVSADLFNVYVTLEVLSLAAVALVTLGGDRAALVAALRYLLAALTGSLTYLAGVALVYGEAGRLDFDGVASALTPGAPATAALVLVTAGLLVKAALAPLHFWLPPAHAGAPAPVSAALSALVVTAAVYLVLRTWLGPFANAGVEDAAPALAALGGAAVLWGSVQALRAERLKMVIAHSTVAQVGYLFLVFGLLWPDPGAEAARTAFAGGALHAVAHAIAKASLFLAAGNVLREIGHDRLPALQGLAARDAITVTAIALAAVSLAGLPPTSGFAAKWLMIEGALEQGRWGSAAVLVIGGLLAGAYLLRLVRPALAHADVPEDVTAIGPVSRAAPLVLALAALLLGFASQPFEDVVLR